MEPLPPTLTTGKSATAAIVNPYSKDEICDRQTLVRKAIDIYCYTLDFMIT